MCQEVELRDHVDQPPAWLIAVCTITLELHASVELQVEVGPRGNGCVNSYINNNVNTQAEHRVHSTVYW